MARKGAATLSSDYRVTLDFSRIQYLLNPEQLQDKAVTIVGVGSGGAPVCDHLTMNGVRNWYIYDPDILDSVNLVKHPRRRSDLGRSKAEVQKEWIIDRNPEARVKAFAEDVFSSPHFRDSIARSDLVLICPDSRSVREFVNDNCVEASTPFVGASVFRTGIGGEVYGYLPETYGCYRCLELFSLRNNLNLSDDVLGLTDEEKTRIYGLGDKEFKASGLSIDIQMIALIQARMALAFLLRQDEAHPAPMRANWIIFGNRPAPGIFSKHLEVRRMLLKPQRGCSCQVQGAAQHMLNMRVEDS